MKKKKSPIITKYKIVKSKMKKIYKRNNHMQFPNRMFVN